MLLMRSERVRAGRARDAVSCARILNDWIDATPWMPRIHTHQGVRQYFQDIMFPQQQIFVIGRPVSGFLALTADDLIAALYVSKPGQGLGRKLLSHCKSMRVRLRLWTFEQNQAAQRFYLREGFSETRRTDGDNEEKLPDILYEWSRE
ncbi:GNAT family N-acetyltransferase [Pseudaestuariivita rosea]|uniref:GNAT family N-acetyltransferase n=1 Tax=Pseudaestuariivita rosea TaxID=2763263 RepID=UPI001ABAE83B|nr:GNAT family N-acetyltransferase [Pseudaestuariivita rosea]